jgi:FkbM family methyltransferase
MKEINEKLIIDIGMHKCEDTDFYLHMNFQVIAIDANFELVIEAKKKYEDKVNNGSLVVLNYAMTDVDYGEVEFNISDETLWSSLKPQVSTRLGHTSRKHTVTTRTLASIIDEFGVPYYCKIDAAGFEDVCLETLSGNSLLPEFISVETECIGENEILTNTEALITLDILNNLGYSKFKLVDQATLSVLSLDKKFYFDNSTLINSLQRKWFRAFTILHQRNYLAKFNYKFRPSASGPFGKFLDGTWVDYEVAKKLLLRHRHDYFNRSESSAKRSFSFWCDWHATR